MGIRSLPLVLATGLLAGFTLACPSEPQAPGDVLLGDFDFEAAPASDGCPFDQDFPPQFTGTVSLDSRTGEAFLTFGEFVHRGTFEGGWVSVGTSARRTLPADCRASPPLPAPSLTVEETIEARLYPEDEARAVSGCSWPVQRPDAGSASWDPGMLSDGGVDVRLICGTIRDRFVPAQPSSCGAADAGVPFEPCVAHFTLSGRRH